MQSYLLLKLPGQAGDAQLSEHLLSNLQAFLDWGMLNIGGFYNVHLTDTASFGGNPSTLRLSDDNRFTKGTVWDAYKKNWVWETGTEYSVSPISISGIYVNSVFLPQNSAVYSVDYPRGRVVFTSPINLTSTVQVEYSYKMYSFERSDVQWFQQLTEGTFRRDDPQFQSYGSGLWSTYPESRAQLPAVVIEPVPKRSWLGKGLGGGQWIYTDVVFHVIAETPYDRNNMLDILTYQNEKRWFMFDLNKTSRASVYPLNRNGFLVNPSSTYPNLLANYPWRATIIRGSTAQQFSQHAQGLYNGIARWTLEVDFAEL